LQVVLIQVTSPALTDSPKLERQVSELVAHINGEYGSLDFIPVHHYHQTIKKDEFYALLSVADLALITPLRDGMNTTSMEFVICQQRTGMSPIVLSEFMGISHHMSEALYVPVSICLAGKFLICLVYFLFWSYVLLIRQRIRVVAALGTAGK
jgi:trehalose 6-phosphate synthase/phosphatase